ncbi:MAG TPA: HAD family hydrolase [Pyrinomonadaceae bacterium]|jgi:D-glycero-D-manno-heptose 1,7-bisphosphate phosphatase|nr:HAD family hydrolase [Pyrinomonadaceae bacterium]
MNPPSDHLHVSIVPPVITPLGKREDRKNLDKAIFWDRDGVIVEDKGHISSPDALVLRPGIVEALSQFRTEFRSIIVTNQSGIARGYFNEMELREIHQRLLHLLDDGGGLIDAIYYCPHHPTEGTQKYTTECECRKPKPGLVFSAAKHFGVELAHSITVGDKSRDIEAGKAAGTRTILVQSSVPYSSTSLPDRIATQFDQVVLAIRDLSSNF